MGARSLVNNFPFDLERMEPLQRAYNRIMEVMFEELVSFITFHYALARRRDTDFWHDAGRPERWTDRLRELIPLWHLRPPDSGDTGFKGALQFHQGSYIYLLAGLRPDFTREYAMPRELDAAQYQAILRRVPEISEQELTRLPDHRAWLEALRADGGA